MVEYGLFSASVQLFLLTALHTFFLPELIPSLKEVKA
jgi:hypothetical protein